MRAVLFDRFGPPAEVLHVGERPVPEPGRGEVRVRMIASPINPSDLLYVRGEYGRRPSLPATPGFEGVGVVEATGGGLLGRWAMGKRVVVPSSAGGTWAEQVIVPARQARPVPAGLPDEQAASFFVNPASAVAMTEYVLRVRPGSWLLQTAAGSALGRMVIRIGRQRAFRTINVVRRREQFEELKRLGADAVICSADESISQRALELTQGGGASYALDAVGGETGSEAVRSLAAGGRMLVYGTLSEQPLSLSPRTLMAGQKTVQGFWLSEWVKGQGVLTMLGLFRRLGRMFQEGLLTSEVAKTFRLEEVRQAVALAETPGHGGKVLLRMA
jgi:NADPH:quinone reductase-like Zn-dependent oxidoreductase